MKDDLPTPLISSRSPRAELARLCRQICLTRETNSFSPLALDDELAGALAVAKTGPGGEILDEGDLLEVYEIEQNRVADAIVLAELLAPRLAQQLQSKVQINPLASPPARPPSHSAIPPSRPIENDRPNGPPGIADLIDGMLDQERRAAAQPRRPQGR